MVLIVIVQKLIFPHFNPHGVNFDPRIERMIHHFSRAQVLQFGAHECRTFSGFHMKEFNDLPQSIIVIDDQSILNV
jgi:hypothetical protein